jgi:putative addiction module killer protein
MFMQVIHYLDPGNHDRFQEWLNTLRDMQGRVAIQRRIDRLLDGNFGDHKFCQEGVWELRIPVGPGYRVYYGVAEESIVLLLCGGSKRTQKKDIARAVEYWEDYQQRIL